MVVGFFETRPEVKAFVVELLDTVPAAEIQEAVLDRFGAENVPSKSRICRLRMRAANPRKITYKQAGMPAPQAEGTAGRNACPTRQEGEREVGKTTPVLWDERPDIADFCSSLVVRGVKPKEIRARAEKKYGLNVTAVQLYILKEGLRRGRWGKKIPLRKQAERPDSREKREKANLDSRVRGNDGREGMAGRNACSTKDKGHQADAKTKQNPPVSPLTKVEKSIAGRNACSTREHKEGRGNGPSGAAAKGNGNGLKREFITDKLRAIPGLPADIAARLNADFIGCCQLPGIIRISNNSCLSRQVGDHLYDLDLRTCRGCPMLLEETVRMMIRAALKARLQSNPIKKQAGRPAPQAEGTAGRNACPTKEVRAAG